MASRLALVTLLAVAAGGCGSSDEPLPTACSGSVEPLARALRSAPQRVVLAGGTSLSGCLRRGASEGEVQDLGARTSTLADELAASAQSSERAALELGYLLGAIRRGARRTNGVHGELVRRLEQAAGALPDSRNAAVRRGIEAGERTG